MAQMSYFNGEKWVAVSSDTNVSIPPIPDSKSVARAWAVFDPGSEILLDHYNVSSVAYVQKGQYDVNFETPIGDSDYATLATADVLLAQTNCMIAISRQLLQTSSSTTVICTRGDAGGNAMVDPEYMKVVVFCND